MDHFSQENGLPQTGKCSARESSPGKCSGRMLRGNAPVRGNGPPDLVLVFGERRLPDSGIRPSVCSRGPTPPRFFHQTQCLSSEIRRLPDSFIRPSACLWRSSRSRFLNQTSACPWGSSPPRFIHWTWCLFCIPGNPYKTLRKCSFPFLATQPCST